MTRKDREKLFRNGRNALVLGAIGSMTLVPQAVSAGILAPQGMHALAQLSEGGDLMPHRTLGLAENLPDGGVFLASGPCPEDLNNFSSDGFNTAYGTDVPGDVPGLDAVIEASGALMDKAQVILASCDEGPAPPPDPVVVTSDIGGQVNAINDTCDGFQIQYRVYCLANQYQSLAQQLPAGGQYYEMKRILQDTADKLRALADDNADAEAPTARVPSPRRGAPAIARAPLPAIRADKVEATAAAATVILQEAQVLLIRSVEESEARYAAYQTVATGMDNSMLLLRS